MKILTILIAVLGLIFSFGCTGQTDEITANLGQEVELKIGQTVSVEEEQIEVKFAEVVNDSRCPSGATCIWQGEVTCILDIAYSDTIYQKTIIQPGLTQEPVKDVFEEYALYFNVYPYPALDKDINTSEYRLQLVIEKNTVLEDVKWFLTSYGEEGNLKDIIDGTEITATFNSYNNQVGGSSGCNIYGGEYQLIGNTLSISEIYYTEMACISPEGVMEQEQEFLTMLSNAESFQAEDDTLIIFCSNGLQLNFTR
jgi:heat shock protein HslJ